MVCKVLSDELSCTWTGLVKKHKPNINYTSIQLLSNKSSVIIFMIVFFSAVVGRTGTYTCLEYLQQIKDEHDFSAEVEIFDMVLT